MKYLTLTLLIATVLLSSCNNNNPDNDHHKMSKAKMDSLRNDLLNADIAFSALSEEKGRNAAFIEYAADDATLLRPYSMPVTGKDSIMALFGQHSDTSKKLTWIPISSDVAHSGEIGFTYGTYSLESKGQLRQEGTYCTVWHKDKDKKWKFILDTGNEGLHEGDCSPGSAAVNQEKKK